MLINLISYHCRIGLNKLLITSTKYRWPHASHIAPSCKVIEEPILEALTRHPSLLNAYVLSEDPKEKKTSLYKINWPRKCTLIYGLQFMKTF